MKYSRKQIDRAGCIIAAEPLDAPEYAEAMTIIDDWRKLYLPVPGFQQSRIVMANDIYAKADAAISQLEAAVVLVAVSDINELREAYPSYFSDANKFISDLSDFQHQCRIKGCIKRIYDY